MFRSSQSYSPMCLKEPCMSTECYTRACPSLYDTGNLTQYVALYLVKDCRAFALRKGNTMEYLSHLQKMPGFFGYISRRNGTRGQDNGLISLQHRSDGNRGIQASPRILSVYVPCILEH